ncbi:MAG TPA: glycosyltransferase family 1 protein, partial [bacterium]|nr:glycosyltransferase family 1 protein [bacterium]
RDLVEDLREIFANFNKPETAVARETPHERNFRMASRAAHELSFRFFQRFLRKIRSGSIISAVESMAALSPVVLGVAPYLTSYKTQHRDDSLIRDLVAHFDLQNQVRITSGRKAWLTDTFSDINGVSLTIRTLASLAHARNRSLTVITSLEHVDDVDFDHANFDPVGIFSLPEYPQQKLAFPPVLDIINFIEREQFDELIVSTPGPVGLCGILAARLLNIPVRGIYHTDFPRYIQEWTDDDTMSEMATRAMKWFYGQMTSIYAPTNAYVEELRAMGFSGRMLSVLSRGANMKQFNPSFRNDTWWTRFGLNGGFKFVYVGRVAYEKNLKALLDAWKLLAGRGIPAELAVVGDGPHLSEVQATYGDVPGLVFTGFMQGEELSRAYAAADALVFPSLTDTFGNVVLEAHASGLPAIVSDRGGPQEIVGSHESGLVVNAADPNMLAEAMQRLVSDPDLYAALKQNAIRSVETRSWDTVLDMLEHPQFVEQSPSPSP